MMRYLFFTGIFFISIIASGQQPSDYLVLKKKNNRTLRTYFPGTFISAVTYDGYEINGVISKIHNDTLFIQQQRVYYVDKLGLPALDTLFYTTAIDYRNFQQFNYSSHTGLGGAPRQRGFSEVALPAIMIMGGFGYLTLESVNTLYRKESFNDKRKLTGMAVAAAAGGSGILMKKIGRNKNKVGRKFRVIYVNMQ
ncbi:MAG TPA: hypothetical protein PK339_10420 [Flavitalea sp.]|nr:hypothetical protein [Flavitalea sp.]